MQAWNLVFEVLALLGAALLLGAVAASLKQHPILGYLLAGVLVGPGGLGLLNSGPALETLAQLGVAVLLFLIGLEFSLTQLRRFGSLALGGGSLQILGTLIATVALGLLFSLPPRQAIAIGAIIATSSTAVVLQLLTDRSELDSQHGRNTIAILLFQDVAVIPLMLLVSALGQPLSLGQITQTFAWTLAATVTFFLVALIVTRYAILPALARAHLFRARDLPVLFGIALLLAAAGAAHSLGLSPALGAFTAGVLLAGTPFAEQLRADLMPFRTAFATLFFTSVGVLLEPGVWSRWWVALGLAAGVLVLKSAVVIAVVLAWRRPWDEAVATGLCLSQIGEFGFLLAMIAVQRQLIDSETFQLFLTASILTLGLTPELVRLAALARQRAAQEGRTAEAGERSAVDAVIVGLGPAGKAVAHALDQGGYSYVVIELNLRTVEEHRTQLPILLGDARQAPILQAAGISRARILVVTLPDPAASSQIIGVARSLNPKLRVLARSRYHLHAPRLLAAGAHELADEEVLVGERLGQLAVEALARGRGRL